MNNQWVTIKQLDKQLNEWQLLKKKYGKPSTGWIKIIRTALKMSVEQLSQRLGLKRGRIYQLEEAETEGAVTLHALNEAASALGCELVYAIVPKNNATLENIIRENVEQIAKERIESMAHTMSLEAQSVGSDVLKMQQAELTKKLMEQLSKKIWSSPEFIKNEKEKRRDKNKKNDLHQELIKNLKKKK
jgi:predicted DNA-binding mobile mystery protein A